MKKVLDFIKKFVIAFMKFIIAIIKSILIFTALILILYFIFRLLVFIYPGNEKTASAFGAKTKIVFKVVDDKNQSIDNANVEMGFYLNKRPGKNPNYYGTTDANGICEITGRSVGYGTYTVTKEGYYETIYGLSFISRYNKKSHFKNGRWQPYGVTNKVILKPIKNPIQMSIRKFEKSEIPTNTVVGIDLEVGDLVKPYGKGQIADFTICQTVQTVKSKVKLALDTYAPPGKRTKMEIFFTNRCDGVYLKKSDRYSEFMTDYYAATSDVYTNKIEFVSDTTDPYEYTCRTLQYNEYLVLRTRTKLGRDNKIEEARYSKIYGRLEFSPHRFSFTSFMNPTTNDANLECINDLMPYRHQDDKIRFNSREN